MTTPPSLSSRDSRWTSPAIPDFHKVYLAVKCQCGTAGLLSVEVAMDKTLQEVRDAMPSLLENLQVKVRMFRGMSCEMHGKMRQGRL